MRVRVDEAWQNDLTGGIDRFAGAKLFCDRRGGVHARDVRAIDRDGTVLNDPAGGIDRDDRSTRHDQIDVSRRILSRQSHHREQRDGGHGGEPSAHRPILVVFQPCLFT